MPYRGKDENTRACWEGWVQHGEGTRAKTYEMPHQGDHKKTEKIDRRGYEYGLLRLYISNGLPVLTKRACMYDVGLLTVVYLPNRSLQDLD